MRNNNANSSHDIAPLFVHSNLWRFIEGDGKPICCKTENFCSKIFMGVKWQSCCIGVWLYAKHREGKIYTWETWFENNTGKQYRAQLRIYIMKTASFGELYPFPILVVSYVWKIYAVSLHILIVYDMCTVNLAHSVHDNISHEVQHHRYRVSSSQFLV